MYIYIYVYMYIYICANTFCVYLYSHTLQEQSLMNSALITELCLRRWIWKSLLFPGFGNTYVYIYMYISSHAHIHANLHTIALQEQSLVSSALITELCLGRWIWKSLKTKTSGAVPWNLQVCIYVYSNMKKMYIQIYHYSTLFKALDLDLKIETWKSKLHVQFLGISRYVYICVYIICKYM